MKHQKLALRRRAAAVAALGLLMLLGGTGTVLAQPETLVVDPAAGDDAISDGLRRFLSPEPGPWSSVGICLTGEDPDLGEHRWAVEFSLEHLPLHATVTQATLTLRTPRPEDGPVQVYGYAGDGEIQPADVEVSGVPVTHTPQSTAREPVDVTDLFGQAMHQADWAGFSLRSDNFGTQIWDCVDDPAPPVLTLVYDVEPVPSAPLVVRGATWYLRNTADAGVADISFVYGNRGDQKLMGDWDGDGIKTPAVYRNGTFYLRNSNDSGVADFVFEFYPPGVVTHPQVPVAGDWNGDGVDGVGVVHNGQWDLFDPGETEAEDEEFFFRYGNASDRPITGDWDGDGSDTPGVVRGFTWFLRNQNTTGVADNRFTYGAHGDVPLAADFDGDGIDGPTVVRGARWYVRNSNSTGIANSSFYYGNPGDIPLVW